MPHVQSLRKSGDRAPSVGTRSQNPRPQPNDGDRACNQDLARDKAFALLHPGDVVQSLDLVRARPALGREEGIQPIGISARIGISYDLAPFLVVRAIGDPPLRVVW